MREKEVQPTVSEIISQVVWRARLKRVSEYVDQGMLGILLACLLLLAMM